MTRDDIIEQADSLTERKGKQLDLKLLYVRRLQKLCRRYRFWWRKSYAIFTLPISTTAKDLATLTVAVNGLTPAAAFTEVGVEEVVSLQRVDSVSSNPPQLADLVPILSSNGFIEMAVNTVPSKPGRYLMDYGDYKTLRVDLTDAIYQFVMTFWALPAPAKDSAITAVPLVPPWYHDVVVDGMVYDIFAASYGEQNLKTKKSLLDYENGVTDMIMRPQFTSKAALSLAPTDGATRSTPGWTPDVGNLNIPPPK